MTKLEKLKAASDAAADDAYRAYAAVYDAARDDAYSAAYKEEREKQKR